MRYYYLPPEKIEQEDGTEIDAPPLRCDYAGSPIVFESPHRYHKYVEEEYAVGILTNAQGQPRLGPDGKPQQYKAKRRKYVLDEEKNAKLAAGDLPPPRNYMDLNEDCHKWVMRAALQPLNLFLKSEDEVKHEHEREMEALRAAQRDEIASLKAQLEKERQDAQAAVEAERRKLKRKE